MHLLPSPLKGLLGGVLILLLALPGCILVVDSDDLYDDHHPHRTRWSLDVIVYFGRTYTVDGAYELSFETREHLTGYTDCNDFDADYEASSLLGTFRVHDLYATDGHCGRNSLEDLFFENLHAARTFRLDGDALTISTRNGDRVLYFSRY